MIGSAGSTASDRTAEFPKYFGSVDLYKRGTPVGTRIEILDARSLYQAQVLQFTVKDPDTDEPRILHLERQYQHHKFTMNKILLFCIQHNRYRMVNEGEAILDLTNCHFAVENIRKGVPYLRFVGEEL